MSLALLLPAGLAALAALALPVLIHLRRRSQQRVVEFAALRWMLARERPRRRVRVDERSLLALRLLLLALLALLLAAPVWRGGESGRAWVVVTPGVDANAARIEIAHANAQAHWLAPGFPPFTQPPPTVPVAFSSLLRELDAQLGADVALTVVVPPALQGLDGERLALGHAVTWRIVPATAPAAAAAPPAESAAPIADVKPTHVAVRYDASHHDALRWMQAALRAWNATSPAGEAAASGTPPYRIDTAAVDAAVAEDTDWLIWLADAPLPEALQAWVEAGGTALTVAADPTLPAAASALVWRSAQGDAQLQATLSGAGRLLVLSPALRPDHLPELLDPDFPDRLRAWLDVARPEPQRAPASSQAPARIDRHSPSPARSLDHLLLLAIALLWLLERGLATRAARQVPT